MEQYERVVEDPDLARPQVRGRARLVEVAVDGEADDGRLPFHREDVEAVGQRLPARQREAASQGIAPRVAGTVHRAVDGRRLAADVLHDVDLAAARPAGRVDVGAQHPEGGPQPLAARDLEAGLAAGGGLLRPAPGLEAGPPVP